MVLLGFVPLKKVYPFFLIFSLFFLSSLTKPGTTLFSLKQSHADFRGKWFGKRDKKKGLRDVFPSILLSLFLFKTLVPQSLNPILIHAFFLQYSLNPYSLSSFGTPAFLLLFDLVEEISGKDFVLDSFTTVSTCLWTGQENNLT